MLLPLKWTKFQNLEGKTSKNVDKVIQGKIWSKYQTKWNGKWGMNQWHVKRNTQVCPNGKQSVKGTLHYITEDFSEDALFKAHSPVQQWKK